MLQTSRHINGLPYKAINDLLAIALENGTVHISEKAADHIRDRHPDDYDLCMLTMEKAIVSPDFVGQSPLHPDNFVLIKNAGDLFLLIAISKFPDDYNEYPLQSAYFIDENVVQRRLRKGFFKRIYK